MLKLVGCTLYVPLYAVLRFNFYHIVRYNPKKFQIEFSIVLFLHVLILISSKTGRRRVLKLAEYTTNVFLYGVLTFNFHHIVLHTRKIRRFKSCFTLFALISETGIRRILKLAECTPNVFRYAVLAFNFHHIIRYTPKGSKLNFSIGFFTPFAFYFKNGKP